MRASNLLHLLLAGAALLSPSALSAAAEEPITLVNHSTAAYVVMFSDKALTPLAVSLNGRTTSLTRAGDKVTLPPGAVATLFATRSPRGEIRGRVLLLDTTGFMVSLDVSAWGPNDKPMLGVGMDSTVATPGVTTSPNPLGFVLVKGTLK